MHVSRRAVLIGGGAVAAITSMAPALASPALLGRSKNNARTISFDCVNTGESLKDVDYWVDGNYVVDALAEINKALRDFVSGDIHPIEPKLLDVLYQIGRRLDTDCRFELICGYRAPATNEMLRRRYSGVAAHSLHMKGQAVDVSLPGRSLPTVHAAAVAMKIGGIGYYPDADFIHVDVGRVRRWVG